jgi:eukaryotic-like serine/threonine-protein kinase
MAGNGDGGVGVDQAVADLEGWLDAQDEAATAKLAAKPGEDIDEPEALTKRLRAKVDETITHVTLAAVDMLVDEAPSSLQRLPILDLGEHDGELRVMRVIGKGGMAEVQLARQRALRRDVALKRVRPGQDHGMAASSLLREARVIGRLEHPNIVPVHMLGCDADGLPVIVMKRVEGLRWRDLIHDRAPDKWRNTNVWSHEPVMRQLEVLLEVCNAVHFAHSLGIIHRDIKPSNVMVGRFGEVYLLDWGVATEAGTESFAHAPKGKPCLPLGTPAFMAPEMADNTATLDERTDIYQLGACLHEALMRKPRHEQTDLVAVLRSVLASEPFDYPSEIPRELANICNRSMAARPADRYQSVIELREAVTHFMSNRGSLRLVDEAEARMGALLATMQAHRDQTQHSSAADEKLNNIRKLFTECRFAFKQVLRQSPESPAAAEGLKTCIEAMARHEWARGKTSAAGALLEELSDPDPVLAGEIAAAHRAEEEKLRDHDRLREDLNIHVSIRQRMVLSGVLGLAALGLGAMFMPVGTRSLLKRSNWSVLLAFVLFGAVFCMVLLFGRHALLKNTANRRVAMTVASAVVGMILTRGLAAMNGVPLAYAASTDLLVCGVATGMGGVIIDRGLGALSLVFVVGAVVVQLVPPGAGTTITFVVTQAIALFSAAYLWKLRGIDVEP